MASLETIFLGAFVVGLLLTIGSFVLGIGHFGLGHNGFHAGGHDLPGSAGVSPFNIAGITAFVAWFGGVGYLATTGWELAAWISLLLALGAGLFGWWVIFLVFTKVLLKPEPPPDPADLTMEGTVARVTMPISGNRIGEIQYTKAGRLHSDGARSVDGSAIARNEEVVVVRYEQGLAYVEPWKSFVADEAPEGRQEELS